MLNFPGIVVAALAKYQFNVRSESLVDHDFLACHQVTAVEGNVLAYLAFNGSLPCPLACGHGETPAARFLPPGGGLLLADDLH